MTSIFDKKDDEASAPQLPQLDLNGRPIDASFVDADTIRINGERNARITGFNAPEQGKEIGGMYVPDQFSDDNSMSNVANVMRIGGFTHGKPQGGLTHGRSKVDFQNDSKDSLGDAMTSLGLARITPFSSDKSIRDKLENQAGAAFFPERAASDPLLQYASENKLPGQMRVKEYVDTPMEYAAFKGMTGPAAAIKAGKEVERLQGILATETLNPELRASIVKKLEAAKKEVWIAGTVDPEIIGGVNYQPHDRTIDNKARDQFTTSLYNASLDVLKSIGGLGEMSGKALDWKGLEELGRGHVNKIKYEQAHLPDVLADFNDIGGDTTWSTIKDTATYLGNLAGGTLPSLGIMMTSAALTGGASLGAQALSALPMALSYTGQFYADQEDSKKNANLAITMGVASSVLDRIGLEGMRGKLGLNDLVKSKELMGQLVSSGRVASMAEAKQLIERVSKEELVAAAQGIKDFAKLQYNSMEAARRGAARLALSTGSEAGTETVQQAAQMIAEGGTWSLDAQYERDFYNQMLNAAVGGGAMGGVMHLGAGARSNAQWAGIADSQEEYEGKLRDATNFQGVNRDQILAGQKGFTSVEDVASQTMNSQGYNPDRDNMTTMPTKRGFVNEMYALIADPYRAMRAHADTAINKLFKQDGTTKLNLGGLKSIMSAGVLPGDHFSGLQQKKMGMFSGHTQEELASSMGVNVAEANAAIRDAYRTYWSKGQPVLDDGSSTPENIKRKEMQKWKEGIEEIRSSMIKEAMDAGMSISGLTNDKDFFEGALVDPKLLSQHQSAILRKMMSTVSPKSNLTATRRQGEQAIKALMSGSQADAASAKEFMSDHGVFADPQFDSIFESNVFTGIENIKQRLSRDIAQTKLLGKDGAVLRKLLDDAAAAGEFESDVDEDNARAAVQVWYEMATGTYHPLDNYPVIKSVMAWGTTLTMLASLPKAGLSSMSEVGLATLGTDTQYVEKQLKAFYSHMKSEIGSDLNKGTSWAMAQIGLSHARSVPSIATSKRLDEIENELNSNPGMPAAQADKLAKELVALYDKHADHTLFERLGYAETGYNTQSKFEYQNSNMKKTMYIFSSLIGLRAQTDSVRMSVIAIAADVINGKLSSLQAIPRAQRGSAFATGMGMTKYQVQSLHELQAWGMDVHFLLNKMDNLNQADLDLLFDDRQLSDRTLASGSDAKKVQDIMLTTLRNFVDSKVVNPQAHNMPKYYNDPRLRIVTVMGRFMATAHTVLIPKLYRDYLKDGHGSMRYSAFSAIALTLLFTMIATMLKDQLAYGEDSPYVKGAKANVQRTINTSGLIGQFEKITDRISPLYKGYAGSSITKDPVGWAGQQITDLSPVAAWAGKAISGVTDVAQGKTEQGVYQLGRASPLIGGFPIAARDIAELFKKGN